MIRFLKSLLFGLPEFKMRFPEFNEKTKKHDIFLRPVRVHPKDVQAIGVQRRVLKNETFTETFIMLRSGHTFVVEEGYKKTCRKLGK